MNIIGYKKGGGSSHTPVEQTDNLHSTAYARVLDLVAEGEIKGLANGLQSIYLDETPLANPGWFPEFQGRLGRLSGRNAGSGTYFRFSCG